MPMYSYACPACDTGIERLVKIAARDEQFCGDCGYRLVRCVDRPGLVYAPTAGGMR